MSVEIFDRHRVFEVVDIVVDLGAEVEVFVVPGDIVAGAQVFGEVRLVAVVGKAVAGAAVERIEGTLGDAAHIPEAVVVREVLPFSKVAVNFGCFF